MWRVGDQCYFLETYTVVPGVITRISGDFCVIKYGDGRGYVCDHPGCTRQWMRLRQSRHPAGQNHPKKRRSNPYMYDH